MAYLTLMERTIKQESLQVGMQAGQTNTLLRLLRRRFSVLPAWAEGRVQSAGVAELETWTDRILDARTLEDVFGDDDLNRDG